MCLTEKLCMSDEFCLAVSYGALAMSSMSVNQQCMLSKMSLKETHTKQSLHLSVDEGTMTGGSQVSNPVFP